MELVVDTCVIVAAFNESEQQHQVSRAFIEEARRRGDQLIVPATLLWEVGATVTRQQVTGDIRADRKFEVNFTHVPVTWELWQETWQSDKTVHIRGPDRIFVSIALKYKAPLVTWDQQLLERARIFGIKTITPADYLGST